MVRGAQSLHDWQAVETSSEIQRFARILRTRPDEPLEDIPALQETRALLLCVDSGAPKR